MRRLRDLRAEFDRAIFVLALGDLVSSFGFSLVFPFLTIYLTAELGASATQAGLVLGLYSVVSIGSNALGGWLADRVGRKPVMTVSITLTAFVIAAMGLVHELAWVAVLTMVLGLVDPPFVPAARAAVADVVPSERRPRAYGLLGMAASVGWIVGPSVGAGLSGIGYGVLFVAAGAIIGCYTVILVVGLRETRPVGGTREDRPVEVASTVADDQDDARAGSRAPDVGREIEPRPAPRAFDARRIFAAFLVLAMAFHGAQFLWVAVLPIYAYADLGVSTTTWGVLFALNGILILAFQLRVTSSAERRSRPRFMAVGALFSGLGYLVVAAISGEAIVLAFLAATIVLVTVGEMFFFPVEPSFVSDLSPLSLRGRYQGLLGAAAGLGTAVAPVVGGMVLDTAPGPLLWLGAAGACGIIAAGLWRLGGRVPGEIART